MFSRLMSSVPWILSIALSVLLLYLTTEQRFLNNKIETLISDNARMVDQRNAVIDINHSMYQSIQLLKQQLDDASEVNESMRKIKKSMDSKLNNAQADIKRLTDGKAQSVSCDDSFSSDVYQRMLDEYGTGDSRKE
jgi:uncharacterized protein YigA (DUF484 family)